MKTLTFIILFKNLGNDIRIGISYLMISRRLLIFNSKDLCFSLC